MEFKKMLESLNAGKIGFGSAPLGNMYRDIPEDEAIASVDAAWESGIRLYDAAPLYGAGLAESRIGKALSKRNRDDYALVTKVGRFISDEIEDTTKRDLGEKSGIFEHGNPNKIIPDFSSDGTLRTLEQSMERLQTSRLDFVFVHDPSRDFYGDEWLTHFENARKGAFRTLERLKDEGVIKGWGLGVNVVEPIELLLQMEDLKPNATLLAGRYTLLDHKKSLQRVMPEALKNDMEIIVGGPYNSGILAGGANYEYQTPPKEILAHVNSLREVADKYNIPLKAAALQFSLAHPAVAAAIPGATRQERFEEDKLALNTVIPVEFWKELREKDLISKDAPLPM